MAVTIVGLGVSISLAFLYVVAIYAAQIFIGAWVGEKLLGAAAGFNPLVGAAGAAGPGFLGPQVDAADLAGDRLGQVAELQAADSLVAGHPQPD